MHQSHDKGQMPTVDFADPRFHLSDTAVRSVKPVTHTQVGKGMIPHKSCHSKQPYHCNDTETYRAIQCVCVSCAICIGNRFLHGCTTASVFCSCDLQRPVRIVPVVS